MTSSAKRGSSTVCRILFALFAFATVWGSVGTSAGESPEKTVAEELKRFDGDWKIVAASKVARPEEASGLVTFSGGKCTITIPATKIVLENTFSIDPTKTPKWIEVTKTKTKNDGGEVRYTYERVKPKGTQGARRTRALHRTRSRSLFPVVHRASLSHTGIATVR